MHEIVVNLHIHSLYSDGSRSLKDICHSAIKSGLDAIITTDHNVLVKGIEGYYGHENRRVLLLTGQEVHDQTRKPQKNHLLVFGTKRMLQLLQRIHKF